MLSRVIAKTSGMFFWDTVYIQQHTGQTFSRRKTVNLFAWTICTPLSGVNHSSGSRDIRSRTYWYVTWDPPHATRPAALRLFALISLPPPRVCL